MSKICTTIEQSKKLVELGLNPESADMCWFDGELLSETEFPPYHYDIDRMETHKAVGRDVFPAWSLSVLLELMPDWYMHSPNVACDTYCCRHIDGMEIYEDNPLDAAFEMIVWLLENKKI